MLVMESTVNKKQIDNQRVEAAFLRIFFLTMLVFPSVSSFKILDIY